MNIRFASDGAILKTGIYSGTRGTEQGVSPGLLAQQAISQTSDPGKKDMTSETAVRPVQTTFPFTQALSPASGREFAVTSLPVVEKTIWVLELEEDGTILYSRPHIIEFCDKAAAASEGLNFFEDIADLTDNAKCRQNFQSFVHARKAAESFNWELERPTGPVNVRVIMTRTFQTGYNSSKGAVMIEMRECL